MSVYSNFSVDLENRNSSWRKAYDLIPARSRVLDVGCSSGYFGRTLIEQKQCHVDGIELNPTDAARAAEVLSQVLVGNIEEQSFDLAPLTGTYDFIVCLDVLEHLLDPAHTLNRLRSLFSSCGKVIFSIPNMANGSVRLSLLQGGFDYAPEGLLDETHLRFHTLRTVCQLVEKSKYFWHSLDHTVSDVLPSTIDVCLKQVGLQSSPEFENYLNSGESTVYQFIGVIGVDPPTINVDPIADTAAIVPTSHYADTLAAVQAESREVFANMVKISDEDSRKATYIVELEARLAVSSAQHQASIEALRAEKEAATAALDHARAELILEKTKLGELQHRRGRFFTACRQGFHKFKTTIRRRKF
jgi:SAM-dependent methyltransferase